MVPTVMVSSVTPGAVAPAGVAVLAHRLEVAEATLVERGGLTAAVAAPVVGGCFASVLLGGGVAVVAGAGRAREEQECEQRSAGSGVLQRGSPLGGGVFGGAMVRAIARWVRGA